MFLLVYRPQAIVRHENKRPSAGLQNASHLFDEEPPADNVFQYLGGNYNVE